MKYSVVVIGAGPGGYVAAIRAAQLGLSVAIVEKYATLGGTCLNVGCIPSKALLDSSEHYHNAATHFAAHGITTGELGLDFDRMRERKNGVVSSVCKGLEYLMKKNKITVYHGLASFETPHRLRIEGEKPAEIEADYVIIATGSKPATLPSLTVDKKRIITSTEALSLPAVPKRLAVIGGGVIGVELGSVYSRLGAEVHIIEYAAQLIPTMEPVLGKELQRTLSAKCYLSHEVFEATATETGATVSARDPNGKVTTLEVDYVLVAVGRRPYTDGLGLENAGIALNERRQIPINAHWQTAQPHIYAIGDVVAGAMLAHKAEEEGVAAVEHLAGQQPHINYLLIPNVVYTWPEVAGVGYTTTQLESENIPYKIGKFPFKALGRAKASGDEQGLVKVLAHAQTDALLGVHIIGPRAADMIAQAVTALEFHASAEDITRMSHAHPTYMEAVKEACLDATGARPIHS